MADETRIRRVQHIAISTMVDDLMDTLGNKAIDLDENDIDRIAADLEALKAWAEQIGWRD